ncbi:MAG: 2Fe-2S iron-sulfur cluster-binding protein, partial [Armatimonadetes bacterium]|nr:2Fe-2S iron-sulfur cluster-binding protein [Armatimonadota bacterium]
MTVAPGTPLLEAAREAGLRLQSPCGGQGRCGKCLVQAPTGVDGPTPVEMRILSPAQLGDGWRLACQTRVVGDTLVTVPESSLAIEHRIMVEGAEREVLVEPNVRKVSLRLPAPSVEDPRADLHRVMEALGEGALPPSRLEPLRDLPGLLRAGGYQITAVLDGGRLAAIEAGDTTEETYGLAVDVGTTTVVAYLCHLPTGAAVAVASDLNSQAQYGDDVISRIQAATGDPEDLRGLNRAIIAVINDLVARTCHEAGVPPDAIYEIAVVGNTCMSHLLLGVSPAGLGT